MEKKDEGCGTNAVSRKIKVSEDRLTKKKKRRGIMNKRDKKFICVHILLGAVTVIAMFISDYFYGDVLNCLITITLLFFYLYMWLVLSIRDKRGEA